MSIQEQIDHIFDGYLHRKGVKKQVARLIDELQASDVDLLLDKIEGIGDVDDYVNETETSIPVERFFAFVDLISALVVLLGPAAIEKAEGRTASNSRYMPWVLKFISDERFYAQIAEQLPSKYRQAVFTR